MGPSQSKATSSSHKKVARETSVLLSQQHKGVFFPGVFFKEVELLVRRRYRFVGRISDLVSTPSGHWPRPLCAEEWQSSPSPLGYCGKGRQ